MKIKNILNRKLVIIILKFEQKYYSIYDFFNIIYVLKNDNAFKMKRVILQENEIL